MGGVLRLPEGKMPVRGISCASLFIGRVGMIHYSDYKIKPACTIEGLTSHTERMIDV